MALSVGFHPWFIAESIGAHSAMRGYMAAFGTAHGWSGVDHFRLATSRSLVRLPRRRYVRAPIFHETWKRVEDPMNPYPVLREGNAFHRAVGRLQNFYSTMRPQEKAFVESYQSDASFMRSLLYLVHLRRSGKMNARFFSGLLQRAMAVEQELRPVYVNADVLGMVIAADERFSPLMEEEATRTAQYRLEVARRLTRVPSHVMVASVPKEPHRGVPDFHVGTEERRTFFAAVGRYPLGPSLDNVVERRFLSRLAQLEKRFPRDHGVNGLTGHSMHVFLDDDEGIYRDHPLGVVEVFGEWADSFFSRNNVRTLHLDYRAPGVAPSVATAVEKTFTIL